MTNRRSHLWTHTHVRTHTRAHARTHVRTHARAHAHTCARTHVRTHTRAHARTHTHTHTSIKVPKQVDCNLCPFSKRASLFFCKDGSNRLTKRASYSFLCVVLAATHLKYRQYLLCLPFVWHFFHYGTHPQINLGPETGRLQHV